MFLETKRCSRVVQPEAQRRQLKTITCTPHPYIHGKPSQQKSRDYGFSSGLHVDNGVTCYVDLSHGISHCDVNGCDGCNYFCNYCAYEHGYGRISVHGRNFAPGSLIFNAHTDAASSIISRHDHGYGDGSVFANADGDKEYLLNVLCKRGLLDTPPDALSHEFTAPKQRTLVLAKQVYSDLALHRTHLTALQSGNIVVQLSKCSALEEAHQTFCQLPQSSIIPWTAIISAYTEYGCVEKALEMLHVMQECGVHPDSFIFVILLKACGRTMDLIQGMKVHTYACWQGLGSHVYVGSTLVSMYGKCGAIAEAEDVFTQLVERNIVSWNAMLSAYIEQGEAEKALVSYVQMVKGGVDLDWRTYVMVLQACGVCAEMGKAEDVNLNTINLKALEIGRAIHTDLRMNGFASDVFVGSTLVSMYGKHGAILDAEQVLADMAQRNVVSWNAMLSAYVDQGAGKKALLLYRQMQQERVIPDHLTYVMAFQACGGLAENTEALEIGRALHADACKQGFLSNVFAGTTLLSMYSKIGTVVDAEYVFSALSLRNIVSWNSMLSAYVDQGQGEKALRLYRQICWDGVIPDQLSLMYALQACGIVGGMEDTSTAEVNSIKQMLLKIGKALHAETCRRRFTSDVFIGNTLISMYSKFGAIVEAQHVFCAMSKHNVVSWNAMISTFIEFGEEGKALQLYAQMQQEDMLPDQLTFVLSLQAIGTLVQKQAVPVGKGTSEVLYLEIVKALHVDATHCKNIVLETVLCNTLINAYAKCGTIGEAAKVFTSGYLHEPVSWNAMLLAYVEQGQNQKAIQMFREMRERQMMLDSSSFVGILQACGAIGSLEISTQLHYDIVCAGYDRMLSVAATLIHVYGSSASMSDAQVIHNEICEPDIISWNACISGHSGVGNLVAGLHAFEILNMTINQASASTFSGVLSACSHCGFIQGLEYYESMSREYEIAPDLKHFGSIVDLLGRAGDFKRLESMLGITPNRVDLALWLSILSACCTHHNLELAKRVFDKVVSLHPKQVSAYIMLSSIYLDAGLLELAAEVDDMRKRQGLELGFPELGDCA